MKIPQIHSTGVLSGHVPQNLYEAIEWTRRQVGRLTSVFNVEGQLAANATPTPDVAGGRDHAVILNSLADHQSLMQDCTARIAPGHDQCAEGPDLFAEAVRAWVTEKPQRGAVQTINMST